ncbi:hypothetical protein EZJ49_01190 [Bdellovibrio bacteriovorus]|uniref:hypothetical protein n=1 Tax=Bdellovibrio bacteriovorus TaxID=959 RepID=UPI0021CF0A03|nr:hypothetical protein [Bdellovibrio bacteriovorus]UXR64866.1 hypothetical protein EZJ49_01190 [Bdellovibrio bacteriovorus]
MSIKHLETLYKLLSTHHVLLENEHFVESVSLVDESMIARRPSGWFCKNDLPHVDINASRWGSIQVDAYAVTQSGSIMVVDDSGHSWHLQVLTPMDMHQVKNLLDELKEDE